MRWGCQGKRGLTEEELIVFLGDVLDCFEAAAMAAPSGKSALFEVLSFM
ncbi:hypothetical protein [Asticcacaulis benevestitus]|nr:hypothetical protein [Asticcacaulis benevestitus]